MIASGAQQSDSAICIHVSILPQTPLPPRLPCNIEHSSLCYTVGPFWSSILFYLFIYLFIFILFIYFWLRWVFVAAQGLPLVATSRGYSLLRCTGFSLWCLLLLQSTGSRHTGFSSCGMQASVVVAHGLQSTGSVAVAHGLSCSAACGIFLDQGSNPCPLQWQADS